MNFLPDFSTDQTKRLSALGVLPTQVAALRDALLDVRVPAIKRPARADVKAVLREIEKRSELLAKRLRGSAHKSKAHMGALALLEPIYWKDVRVTHPGPNAAAHLCPLLDALALAAREGRAKIPRQPERHKTAAVEPIEAIFCALLFGWRNDANVMWFDPGSTTDDPPPPSAPQFPKKFHPSWSHTSTFFRIVGICYEAIGGNASPERAIRAYMAQRKKELARDVAAFSAGLARRRTKPRKTSGVPS